VTAGEAEIIPQGGEGAGAVAARVAAAVMGGGGGLAFTRYCYIQY